MAPQDYEQKKRECWEEFCKENDIVGDGFCEGSTDAFVNGRAVFNFAFDRAYALGKEKETISQEEDVEKAAEEYAEPSRTWASGAETQEIKDAFKAGANFALGKQEKDAEDTVIQGWVAVDEAYDQCFLHTEKPIQKAQPIADTGDYDTVWDSNGKTYLIDAGLFPDMNSDSAPEEVEIILKRKKK